jgi:hypothetical protein
MAAFIRTFVRIPDDLHAALKERAQRDQRSLNGQIIWLLRRAIESGL